MNSESYTIEELEKYTLIKVHEDKFTAKLSPELKAELVVLNGKKIKNFIIDLSDVGYCDSSGLSVILVANRIAKENNGCLVLCNLNATIMKLIDISQLGSVLNITPTLSEAIDYLFMDELEKGFNQKGDQLN
ncbi:MAG: anti-anti-sigma factor [Verrucomicrobia bacterium]|nr:anti-anti-sigma factor [Verrucomicrobiota bacterium]|tara:strand:+ start:614 stop:1009 length:396 start_codon:yes stop_codon:yes gene_type:complete